jgi:hypothetical protein
MTKELPKKRFIIIIIIIKILTKLSEILLVGDPGSGINLSRIWIQRSTKHRIQDPQLCYLLSIRT